MAVGIGVLSWGRGRSTIREEASRQGRGLSVGEVGVTRATGLGQVYNLKKLADFDGNYVAGGAEVTVAGGAGVTGMKESEPGWSSS